MPKLPGNRTKVERIDAVRSVLKRWGRLNKQQVDQHVSAILGCSAEEIARSLYRDLAELIDKSEIKAVYFSRDGVEIPDYDPETHKNMYCEWVSIESEASVVGGSFVKSLGAELVVSNRLKGAISVVDKTSNPDPAFLNYYCFFNPIGVCIRIRPEDLPLSLVAARRASEINPALALQQIESTHGNRIALLLLPIPNISSFKDATRCGHFKIHAENPSQFSLVDLGSKNGTSYRKLTKEEAKRLWTTEKFRKESTVSVTQGSTVMGNEKDFVAVRAGDPTVLQPPVLVLVSKALQILVL